ncbi:MAG: Asp-tRNA(Asn)/Glu-tRNA(Gln) amidotransferase subunit GatA [Parcubacteria group bacterium]|nr:Asp-tRNA(Asn)/Glu-tRNA(Gln) amidotransferase subunit GatA [Parcubacteria group bacterium]
MSQFLNLTIEKIHKGLTGKKFSAQELTQHYLDTIQEKDKDIGAFLHITEKMALEQADVVDKAIANKEEISKMSAVPYAVKDAIMVKDVPCTAGSKILENYTAVYDATCIDKLKTKGAICLGKTNLDEFAMGSSTEHSAYKTTKNPHDLTRVPGGSSGGSAASVAANECIFSLGSDTGGSIRQPASFCGVVGLKPTYGAVSRYGLIAFASSLDQIGPFASNVEDCEIVFNAIKGIDKNDSTSVELKQENSKFDIKKVKIGIPKEYFAEGIDKEVKEVVEGMIEKAEKNGAKIEEVSLPHSKYALPCYYIVATSEASANLARFDGIKYGLSVKGKDLIDEYFKTKTQGFGDEVKRRIMLGSFCLSSGYYDAYYSRAQKVRALIRQDFEKVFKKVDFLFTPVSPFPAFKLGEKMDDPLRMYLADIYTISVNLAGLPALSMPAGKVGKLPVGLQIIGNHFTESKILQAGKFIETIL